MARPPMRTPPAKLQRGQGTKRWDETNSGEKKVACGGVISAGPGVGPRRCRERVTSSTARGPSPLAAAARANARTTAALSLLRKDNTSGVHHRGQAEATGSAHR